MFHTGGASFGSRRASNSISRCLEVVALAQGGEEEEEEEEEEECPEGGACLYRG